jgi:RNA polymerase sigma-70 factor (ECF subfamily)
MTPQELEAVLDRCQRAIRAYLAGMGVPLDAVDDLAQEVFVDYYYHADAQPAGVAELAWLKGMARNKARNWFRHQGRQVQLRLRVAERLEQAECPLEDPELPSPLLDRLLRCLDRLPPEQRALVQRYYSGDEGADHIAASLGRSASGIRMLMLRLREQLGRCIQMGGPQAEVP